MEGYKTYTRFFVQFAILLFSVKSVTSSTCLCPCNTESGYFQTDTDDPGSPLFLTPYIESKNLSEARLLAKVPFTEELFNIKSYAGLFTVDKKYNSNLFLWYFPPIKTNSSDAPVILWLDGGPGTSGLFGLLKLNGPIGERNGSLYYRERNLANNHHAIYVDNPVGTGYSFTNDSRGYATEQTQIADQLYAALIQMNQLFPELRGKRFYVNGISYAGKIVPSLAFTIHKKNVDAELKINLQGLSIGNGICDPINQLDFHDYYLQLGLIDSQQSKIFEDAEERIAELIRSEKWNEANDVFEKYFFGINSIFYNLTGFESFNNVLHTELDPNLRSYNIVAQSNFIRKNIHVGSLTFHGIKSKEVFNNLKGDILKSVAPLMEELLEHYCIIVYNGQLDLAFAYPMTVNYLKKLKFSGSDVYNSAERYIWRVGENVAGYVHRGGNLTDVLVRNAGHLVPYDQPEWAEDIIKGLVTGCIVK